jgi:hypothetical protein
MPKVRLSRTAIDKLEFVSGKQIKYMDTKMTGFGVMVNNGTRTYFVRCKVKGRHDSKGKPLELYESLGRTDVVRYDDAVSRAKDLLEDAALICMNRPDCIILLLNSRSLISSFSLQDICISYFRFVKKILRVLNQVWTPAGSYFSKKS